MMFWFALALVLFLILAWPAWPYTRGRWPYRYGGVWPYALSLVATLLLVLLFLSLWMGLIVTTYP